MQHVVGCASGQRGDPGAKPRGSDPSSDRFDPCAELHRFRGCRCRRRLDRLDRGRRRVRVRPPGEDGKASGNWGGRPAQTWGVAAARGDLLTFLDSDDQAEPAWLETMRAQFERSHVDVALCGVSFIEEDGSLTLQVPPLRERPMPDEVVTRFLAGCWM